MSINGIHYKNRKLEVLHLNVPILFIRLFDFQVNNKIKKTQYKIKIKKYLVFDSYKNYYLSLLINFISFNSSEGSTLKAKSTIYEAIPITKFKSDKYLL